MRKNCVESRGKEHPTQNKNKEGWDGREEKRRKKA
jgi:hypothetical protein